MLHDMEIGDRVQTCDGELGTVRELIGETCIYVEVDGHDSMTAYWFEDVEPYSRIETVRDLIAILQKCNPDAKPAIRLETLQSVDIERIASTEDLVILVTAKSEPNW